MNTPAPLVLIVDDFAMREHTTTQSDDLCDLVSDRAIASKPLILTDSSAGLRDGWRVHGFPDYAEARQNMIALISQGS